MELFIQAAAGALLAVVLGLALEKQGKDMTLLLTVAVCCMVTVAAVSYFRPVMTFLEELQAIGDLNDGMIGTLLKILGIGILTEVCATVCSDAGNSSLAKALQLLGATAILWLSLPVFSALITLIQEIMGAL